MTACLGSVRSLQEAAVIAAAGVPWIDLKEPAAGALGAVSHVVLREVATAWCGHRTLSATIGDCWDTPDVIPTRVQAVAAAGLDYAKVGLFAQRPGQLLLGALADACRATCGVIAVCFAEAPPTAADLDALAATGLAGLMLDTADKQGPGLCQLLPLPALQAFVSSVKSRGLLCGLAGRLALSDVPVLLPLGADYLGFRGALCGGSGREAAVDHNAALQLVNLFGVAGQPPPRGALLQEGFRDGHRFCRSGPWPR